jgi:hypothetical protein
VARFRKVDPRCWADAKFRALSERGKLLWFYLLTGPEVTSVPGVIVAGRLHLAEALGWSPEGFDEAFGEAFRQGMAKADWKARVIWLPNAWKYNRPESPNVVRSWRDHWDNTPECELKAQAYQTLKDFAEGLGEAFREAFREACGHPSPNPEPEPEPEPEPDIPPAAKPPGRGKKQATKKARAAAKHPESLKPRERDDLFDAIAEVTCADPAVSGSRIGKIKAVLVKSGYTAAEVRALPAVYAASGFSIPLTLNNVLDHIGRVRNPSAQPGHNGTPVETEEEVRARHQAERARAREERRAAEAGGGMTACARVLRGEGGEG